MDSHRDRLLRHRYAKVGSWYREFENFVKELCRNDHILELYLVGSRARGNNRPSSDFDVVVVVKDDYDPLAVAETFRLLRRAFFPLDLIVICRRELKDPVYTEMLSQAKKLCSKDIRI